MGKILQTAGISSVVQSILKSDYEWEWVRLGKSRFFRGDYCTLLNGRVPDKSIILTLLKCTEKTQGLCANNNISDIQNQRRF